LSPQQRADTIERLPEYRPSLLRLARYLTHNAVEAEDLVQTTLLAAIEHIDSWQGRGPLKNWLFTILSHQNHRRARNKESPVDHATWEQLAASAGWAADAADVESDRNVRIELVQDAILKLPEEDREVLLLRDVEHIEGSEAAGMLGLSLPALKSRLHRARLRLLAAVRELSAIPAPPQDLHGGPMTCMEVLERLGDYVEGSIEPSTAAAIEAHVAGCTRCRQFGNRYAKLIGQLQEIEHNS